MLHSALIHSTHIFWSKTRTVCQRHTLRNFNVLSVLQF